MESVKSGVSRHIRTFNFRIVFSQQFLFVEIVLYRDDCRYSRRNNWRTRLNGNGSLYFQSFSEIFISMIVSENFFLSKGSQEIFQSRYSNEKRKRKENNDCSNYRVSRKNFTKIAIPSREILLDRYKDETLPFFRPDIIIAEREANKSNEVIPRIATALLRTTSNKSYLCAGDTSCCNYRYRVTTRWSRFELSHRSFRKQSICHYEPRSLIRHRRMNNAWSRWKTSRVFS